jgi:hypothetical protein
MHLLDICTSSFGNSLFNSCTHFFIGKLILCGGGVELFCLHWPYLHTHHILISLLNQTYISLFLCNPWHKHSPLQQLNYILTHKRALKLYSPHTSSPVTSLSLVPTLVPSF